MNKMTTVAFLILTGVGTSFASAPETSASTEIFGYDRMHLPATGKALRSNMFVTLEDEAGNKFIHLNDLRVVGYKDAEGKGSTAGVFNFYVPMKVKNGTVVPATNATGRVLSFYWFDNDLHEPGWYDSDGTSRWENVVFDPGQAFIFQGNGLVFESKGLVVDTGVNRPVPPNTHVAVGNAWAKRVNICDLALTDNGTHDISGGLTLERMADGPLDIKPLYSWYCVTNGYAPSDIKYREPGWYTGVTKSSKVSPSDGVFFEVGESFVVQGYQSNPGEAAPELRFRQKPQALNQTGGK